MNKRAEFFDQFTNHLASPWWLYLMIGIELILFSVLIFIFPELLAYLVAAFLMVGGISFIAVAMKIRNMYKKYHDLRYEYDVEP